jgi:16S rRNA (uracil1498-N3)-methyltransferase
MQRYFASVVGKQAFLSDSSAHHLLDVMRAKVGEEIEIVDGGDLFNGTVTSLSPLVITVSPKETPLAELPVHLALAFALLKHGNDELVLEKGTELGVASFRPFISSRTIIRLDSKADQDKKLDRYAKIVKGAAEQSKRTVVPVVEPIVSFKALLETPADSKLFAYENVSEDVASLPKALENLKPGETCLIVIGPEGGFSPLEAEQAKAAGFQFVSLGRRILRAETASLYAASVFGYLMEEKA